MIASVNGADRGELLAQVRNILATLVDKLPADEPRRITVKERRATDQVLMPTPGRGVTYRVARPIGMRTRLSERQRMVYQWLYAHPDMPARTIVTALKLTEGQVGAALRVLKESRLVGQAGAKAVKVATVGKRRLVDAIRNQPLDSDIAQLITADLFVGSTQAEAVKYVLSGVPRPLKTRTLMQALRAGGLAMGGVNAAGNLHKTLRKRTDMVLVKGSGWSLAV